MNFLKKIKSEYNTKLFNDYIINQKYDLAYQLVLDLKGKDQDNFLLFLKSIYNQFIDLPDNFYKKKIIWTLSYDLSDMSFVNKFLNYYLSKNSKSTHVTKNYTNTLSDYFTKNKTGNDIDKITFNDFLKYSSLYQNLLLFDCDKEFLFLDSCASFFENNQKDYFTNPNIVFCYFYIITSPEILYLRYKNIHKSSEAAFNEMFNFSHQHFLNPKQKKIKVYENRTDINTNIKSWTDSNVMNTYKGKIISYQRLLDDTEEVLIEILFHLKQYNYDIEINMDDIKNFISSNNIESINNIQLSNNEKKFLNRNLDQTINFSQ